MRILLVEDAEVDRDMLAHGLRREGFVVREAESGAEAIRAARESVPDLIIMDTTLPVMDCYEATRAIKADPEIAHIPVLILSTHSAASDQEKAVAAGCDDYDVRPVNMTRLLRKIRGFRDKARSKPSPKRRARSTPEDGRVLVVDLNTEPSNTLARAIQARGHKARLTSEATEAIDYMSRRQIDLVIFDAREEFAQARILIRRMQQDEKLSSIRFMVLTSEASHEELRRKISLQPRQVMVDPDLDDVLLRVDVRAGGKR